jgi:hypothetical protein
MIREAYFQPKIGKSFAEYMEIKQEDALQIPKRPDFQMILTSIGWIEIGAKRGDIMPYKDKLWRVEQITVNTETVCPDFNELVVTARFCEV